MTLKEKMLKKMIRPTDKMAMNIAEKIIKDVLPITTALNIRIWKDKGWFCFAFKPIEKKDKKK